MPGKKEFHKVEYGANQSARTHTLTQVPDTEDRGKKSVLATHAAYGVQRFPKSYKAIKSIQTRRHLATVLAGLLDYKGVSNYQEVQVGTLDATKLIVSTNTKDGNTKLIKILDDYKDTEGRGPTVGRLAQEFRGDEGFAGSICTGQPRSMRHFRKFANDPRIIESGLANYQIVVAKPDADIGRDGLHAERRIVAENGKDPVGIKRPCAHCYQEIYGDVEYDDDHIAGGPGPAWQSEAAQIGYTGENAKRLSPAITNFTVKRESLEAGRINPDKYEYTADYGTDSDSDASEVEIDSARGLRKRQRIS